MHDAMITSPGNERVKAWVRLGKRSERDRSGRFLVEGRRETERLARSLTPVERLWCPAYAGEAPPDVTLVSEAVFDKVSRRQNPDGIAAIFDTPPLDIGRFAPGPDPIVLVADRVEKPGNLGAMIRTCDAFGASFVASDPSTDLVNPNVIRSAQGSFLATPTAVGEADDVRAWCQTNTTTIVLRPDADRAVWDVDLRAAVSIVVGAESDGVGPSWLGVGSAVAIPMHGSADSLNASVAAAIVLAEATRQRST